MVVRKRSLGFVGLNWGSRMQDVTPKSPADQISVELSARRTGMSFQRTRMSADRTLMSVTFINYFLDRDLDEVRKRQREAAKEA